jgi:cytochrome c oxidase cbb3-type subunit 4
MFKNYFNGIEGIASYPVFSLIVFFLFFLSLMIWLVRADKKALNEISRMPLDESNGDEANTNPSTL